MTNFRLVQIETVCRLQFKFDENIRKFSKQVETLWVKEKLLVTSNFSFTHSVFKRLVSQGRQKVSLCGNGLRPVDNSCHIGHTYILKTTEGRKAFENIVGKRENAGKEHFSSIPTMFFALSKLNFKFSVEFILLSANSFNFYCHSVKS